MQVSKLTVDHFSSNESKNISTFKTPTLLDPYLLLCNRPTDGGKRTYLYVSTQGKLFYMDICHRRDWSRLNGDVMFISSERLRGQAAARARVTLTGSWTIVFQTNKVMGFETD